MATRLTRINETDWTRLENIRKSLVMGDGQNRTMADAISVVLDRYDITAEAIFEVSKDMVLSVIKQHQAAQETEPKEA